ncbi:MAG: hypothetical protein P4L33_04290 [Capsulimonadaceae bacterium]|nr:hypothetical protein [Capsulimonadaceae bacterium]
MKAKASEPINGVDVSDLPELQFPAPGNDGPRLVESCMLEVTCAEDTAVKQKRKGLPTDASIFGALSLLRLPATETDARAVRYLMTAIESHVEESRRLKVCEDADGFTMDEVLTDIRNEIERIDDAAKWIDAYPNGTPENEKAQVVYNRGYCALQRLLPLWLDRVLGVPGAFLFAHSIDYVVGINNGMPQSFDYERDGFRGD